eukprot:40073-Chlamydomonas_euryale.AAC.1
MWVGCCQLHILVRPALAIAWVGPGPSLGGWGALAQVGPGPSTGRWVALARVGMFCRATRATLADEDALRATAKAV